MKKNFILLFIISLLSARSNASLKQVAARAIKLPAYARLYTTARHASTLAKHSSSVTPSSALIAADQEPRYIPHYDEDKKRYYQTILQKPWAAVARHYIEKFEKTDGHIRKEFKDLATKNIPDFDEHEQRFLCQEQVWARNIMLKDIAGQSFGTIKMAQIIIAGIRQTLRDVQLNVPIQIVPNPVIDTMGTDHSTIYVGKQLLKNPAHLWIKGFNEKIIQAIALHEVQHLFHDDALDRTFYGHIFPAAATLRMRLHTLQEERADIMAGLSSPACAQALARYHRICASLLDKIRLHLRKDASAFKGQTNFWGEPHPIARAHKFEILAQQMNNPSKPI